MICTNMNPSVLLNYSTVSVLILITTLASLIANEIVYATKNNMLVDSMFFLILLITKPSSVTNNIRIILFKASILALKIS